MTNYAPCACEKQQSDFLVEQLSDNTENEYKQILSNVLSLDAGKVKNIYGRVFETGSSSVINCSNRAIRTIPKFKTLGYTNQATIDCLDLSHNKIEIISESVFYGLIFRCIDFSFNKINKVSRNAFSGLLNSLYVLKFNRNELTSSSLPAYFISKLSQLSVLSLAYNKIGLVLKSSVGTRSNSV
jgi:Leucine-rich repeat (LRR) protein